MNAVAVEVVRFVGGPVDGRERVAWRAKYPAEAYVKWIDGGFTFLDATVHEVQPEGFELYERLVSDDPRVVTYQWWDPHPDEPLVTRSGKVLTDDDIRALAEEAERGYDVDHLLRRQRGES